MSSMASRNYTEEEFKTAVETSTSIGQVLTKLGLKPAGGNYKQFKAISNRLQIDTSHFIGQGHLKGKTHSWNKFPLCKILVENSIYTNISKLRKRLISNGIFEYKCCSCLNTEWLGKPISLELDHINGINNYNRIENLRVICPNYHSQTPTYRGKNKKKFEPQMIHNC